MSFAFGPNGFDDDRKGRAEQADELLSRATAVFGFAAAGATLVLPPLAAGLGLAAALGPLLGISFRRIRRDPLRQDFFQAVHVPPPALDPTAIVGDALAPTMYPDGALAALVAYPSAAERTAAHAGAMVTSVERAMGAYAAHSTAAVELRVVEASAHAQRALSYWRRP